MAAGGSAEGEGRNGGGGSSFGKPEQPVTHSQAAYEEKARARPPALSHERDDKDDAEVLAYEDALAYAHGLAYVSLAVKSSGVLALSVSTVILLGGYVQSLGKKDFFCITVISAIQAAGIFNDYYKSVEYLFDFSFTICFFMGKLHYSAFISPGWLSRLLIPLLPVLGPLLIGILYAETVFLFGPLVCAVISSWRIAKLNHSNRGESDSVENMMAAMNIFYSLIIFQGAMFVLLYVIIGGVRRVMTRRLRELVELPREWGTLAIHMYLYDISAKCRKDSLSTKGWSLMKYAAELLGSESQEDYLYGARLLSAFVKKRKEDVRLLLLASTDRIQRLIDSLWIGTGGLDERSTEIRELAAMIVADLAGHINVARYPGAMCSISSLLLQEETTWIYRQCISDPQRRPMGPLTQREQERNGAHDMQTRGLSLIHNLRRMRDTDLKRPGVSEERRLQKRDRGATRKGISNKLAQQGLIILERLASNSDNRRIICSTPGLLRKITAPVYSATLIEDVKTKPLADIVTGCLKVLYQLIRAPHGSHEIFSNNDQALNLFQKENDQALKNLKSILELGNNEADYQELQLVAMEILTELPFLSIKINEDIEQVLIEKQLQLFLANGNGAAMAGRALAFLSTKSASLIMTTQSRIIDILTGILDDENITQRTIAAEIMANLYAHCNVDNTMKEILQKVLIKIMSLKTKSQKSKISAGQNNPAALGDEENQANSVAVATNNEGRQSISTDGDHTVTEEISDQEREEQEAFLSLAQEICAKLNNADLVHLDRAIQSAVGQNSNAESVEQRREAFVDKLKTIIYGNLHATECSLRIVKLCGQIAKSVLRCEQYVKIFRNKEFKSALSEASKTMSELESCMFFVGTDFGPRKTVQLLLSEIEDLVRDTT